MWAHDHYVAFGGPVLAAHACNTLQHARCMAALMLGTIGPLSPSALAMPSQLIDWRPGSGPAQHALHALHARHSTGHSPSISACCPLSARPLILHHTHSPRDGWDMAALNLVQGKAHMIHHSFSDLKRPFSCSTVLSQAWTRVVITTSVSRI